MKNSSPPNNHITTNDSFGLIWASWVNRALFDTLNRHGEFVAYSGPELTQENSSYRFLWWKKTQTGNKLVFQKVPWAIQWFDAGKDDPFAWDPNRTIDLLWWKKNAEFWWFEFIDDSILLVPGAEVINHAIQIYNTQIIQSSKDRIGISFYTPDVDLVPFGDYINDYIYDAKLPLASVSANTCPNLREALHDVSYHLSTLLLPSVMHDSIRRQLQIIVSFIKTIGEKVPNNFTFFEAQRDQHTNIMSHRRKDVVRTVENATALLPLLWYPSYPDNLRVFGSSKDYWLYGHALSLLTKPVNQLYPVEQEAIFRTYSLRDTFDGPGYIQSYIVPFCSAFHGHILQQAKRDPDACYKTIYELMGISDVIQCIALIDESIHIKNKLVEEHVARHSLS